MKDRLDIARKIVEETCPHRRLKLENIQIPIYLYLYLNT